MVRVGGGFATLEEHIKQIGPFECIKIYKHIKTEEAKGISSKTAKEMFEDAVVFFMKRLKASQESIEKYVTNSKSDTMELFGAIIDMLQARRDASQLLAKDKRKAISSRAMISNRSTSAQAFSSRSKASSRNIASNLQQLTN